MKKLLTLVLSLFLAATTALADNNAYFDLSGTPTLMAKSGNVLTLGTIGAQSVCLFTNNSSRFCVTGAGDVTLPSGYLLAGASSLNADVTNARLFSLSGSATVTQLALEQSTADATGAETRIYKTRATDGSANTIVANGDVIGQTLYYGANGATFDAAARIQALIAATPGAANDMPGTLRFATVADNSGTLVNRLAILADGSLLMSGSQGVVATDADVTALNGGSPLIVVSDTSAVAEQAKFIDNGASSVGATLQFLKTRAGSTNLDANTVVQSGDTIAKLTGYGADGAAYRPAAEMKYIVDNTPGSSDMPGAIVFSVTADGAATLTQALKIGNDLKAVFAGQVTAGAALAWTGATSTGAESVNAAGANQGNSTALSATKYVHLIAAGDNTTGVVLPAAGAGDVGKIHILISTVQAKLMNIWPASGATINGAGANAVFVAGIATAGHGQDICIVQAADTWYCG